MTEIEFVGRIGLAALLGAALGLERESRGKAAGLRTHALVAVGAALFTIAGSVGFKGVPSSSDPTRVAAQVATGIGFIGAGTIVRTGATVRGLTTAATLWMSAAMGVTVAFGLYTTSIGAIVIVMLVVVGLGSCKPFMSRQHHRTVWVRYDQGHGTLGPLLRGLEDVGCEVQNVRIDDVQDGAREVSIDVSSADDGALERMTEAIRDRPEVRSLLLRSRTAAQDGSARPMHRRRHPWRRDERGSGGDACD